MKTAVKITAKIKLQIFALYMGQDAYRTMYYSLEPDTLHPGSYNYVVDPHHLSKLDSDSHPNIGKVHDILRLKSLDKISDNDCVQVALIAGVPDSNAADPFEGKQIIGDYKTGANPTITPGEWGEIIDFLRSRGYALPYGEYSVDDLLQAGVYKLI